MKMIPATLVINSCDFKSLSPLFYDGDITGPVIVLLRKPELICPHLKSALLVSRQSRQIRKEPERAFKEISTSVS